MKALLKYKESETVITLPKYVQKKLIRLKKIYNLLGEESDEYQSLSMEIMDYLSYKSLILYKYDLDYKQSYYNNITMDLETDLNQESVILEYSIEAYVETENNSDTLFLYWVEDNVDEKWFVISTSEEFAHDYHSYYEGLDTHFKTSFFKDKLEKYYEEHEDDRIYDDLEIDDDIKNIMDFVHVTEVLELPKNYLLEDDALLKDDCKARHAQIIDLIRLGFNIIDDGDISCQRIVKYNNIKYQEGDMEMMIQLSKNEFS